MKNYFNDIYETRDLVWKFARNNAEVVELIMKCADSLCQDDKIIDKESEREVFGRIMISKNHGTVLSTIAVYSPNHTQPHPTSCIFIFQKWIQGG